ncbi:MAG: amidohydrolase family protein, partial [Pyrinomonadaceae bacterium]
AYLLLGPRASELVRRNVRDVDDGGRLLWIGATKTAAGYLGQNSLGTIEVGKTADLLLIKGNPLDDITNTRNIELVVKAGEVVDRNSLLTQIMGDQ